MKIEISLSREEYEAAWRVAKNRNESVATYIVTSFLSGLKKDYDALLLSYYERINKICPWETGFIHENLP